MDHGLDGDLGLWTNRRLWTAVEKLLLHEIQFLAPDMVGVSLRRLAALLVDALDVLRALEVADADPVDGFGRRVGLGEPLRDPGVPARRVLPLSAVERRARAGEVDLCRELVGG